MYVELITSHLKELLEHLVSLELYRYSKSVYLFKQFLLGIPYHTLQSSTLNTNI